MKTLDSSASAQRPSAASNHPAMGTKPRDPPSARGSCAWCPSWCPFCASGDESRGNRPVPLVGNAGLSKGRERND